MIFCAKLSPSFDTYFLFPLYKIYFKKILQIDTKLFQVDVDFFIYKL